MINILKKYLVRFFPSIGIWKRSISALRDSFFPEKASYSQHGEDQFILAALSNYDLASGIYVDVGANHPTSISNTYLFYRKGYHGITIEPNPELSQLHQKFRPRDIILNIGCSNQPSLGCLNIGKAPVLSHFSNNAEIEYRDKNYVSHQTLGFEVWKSMYVPILSLDMVIAEISCEWIYFLSIDVEGLDYEVLQGAKDTLNKVLFCCIEANDGLIEKEIDTCLTNIGFSLKKKIYCNLIYFNNNDSFNRYLH